MLQRVASLRLPPQWRDEDEDELLESVDDKKDDDELSEPVDNKELAEALAEQAKVQFQVSKLYPGTQQFKKFRQPERGRRTTLLGASRLRYEVMVEPPADGECEGSEDGEESAAYYNAWAGGWAECKSVACENEGEITAWIEAEDVQDGSVEDTHDPYLDTVEEPVSLPISDPIPAHDALLSTSAIPTSAYIDHDGVKEPQPFDLPPTISTILDESEKQNFPPATQHKPKAVPPHLRRRKSFTLSHNTLSESGKLEMDVLKRIRCLNSWIVVGS